MSTRPARPGLDAWLAKADEVVAEARSTSLSRSDSPTSLG